MAKTNFQFTSNTLAGGTPHFNHTLILLGPFPRRLALIKMTKDISNIKGVFS